MLFFILFQLVFGGTLHFNLAGETLEDIQQWKRRFFDFATKCEEQYITEVTSVKYCLEVIQLYTCITKLYKRTGDYEAPQIQEKACQHQKISMRLQDNQSCWLNCDVLTKEVQKVNEVGDDYVALETVQDGTPEELPTGDEIDRFFDIGPALGAHSSRGGTSSLVMSIFVWILLF